MSSSPESDANEPANLPSDAEIRARLERVRAGLDANQTPIADEVELELHQEAMTDRVSKAAGVAVEAPDLDVLDRRLGELRDRAASARQTHQKSVGMDDEAATKSATVGRASGVGLMVAYMIVGFPLGCAAIGWAVDRVTGMNIWVGTGTVVGFFLGIFVTLVIVNRRAKDL